MRRGSRRRGGWPRFIGALAGVAALILIAGLLISPRVNAQIQRNADQVLGASYNAGPPPSVNVSVASALPAGTSSVGSVSVNSTSGATQLLATNIAATAGQSFTSTTLGQPKLLSLCLSASAATTLTVQQSIDGTNYFQGTLFGTGATSANFAPAAAGSQCEALVPTAFVKVTTSAAVTVSIHAQASY